MKRRIRFLWRVLVGIMALLFAAGVIMLRRGSDISQAIRSGKLGYTCALGWVNWGHAIPDGPADFLRELREKNAKCLPGGTFKISLPQSMSGRYGPVRVTGKISHCWEVEGGLSDEVRQRLAWMMFAEISSAFEKMQASFPNSIDKASSQSAFREGDLAGNRLAFLAAEWNLDESAIKFLAGACSPSESLALLPENPVASGVHWGGLKLRQHRSGGLSSRLLREFPPPLPDPALMAKYVRRAGAEKLPFHFEWIGFRK